MDNDSPNGSARYQLDVNDLGQTAMFGVMVGVAAALTWLADYLSKDQTGLDLGSWKLLITGVLGTVLEAVRRWLVDHKRGEIVPFSAAMKSKKRRTRKSKAAGIVLLLMLPAFSGMTWSERRVDHVSVVEVNTFGDQARTALIYRDVIDGFRTIRDWRWLSVPEQIPQPLGDGRFVAVWSDSGSVRTVYCDSVRYTRTREDRELAERSNLPEHKRLKLSR